ncbi:carbohydrate kinase family protein [Flavobacterium sp.]|uniref:carbohydrate kinase family protein n=1 Tax=Flavobacterium sp. TaxID=239 RepID=UPI002617730B|nr:carbohydrate kinase family protein [Flavobacterium sp.]MDD2986138.1 carbohydrate kinase family protein [Flavobacterium sp.]
MISIKKIQKREATCVGSGLVALDVIVNGSPSTPAKLCAGGSCGNVLSILAFLGWDSMPIARLADNNASEKLFDDFLNIEVNTSLITTSKDGTTPIIIHRILKDKEGNPKHKFEFRVPDTNAWLPMYRPVLASAVNELISLQSECKVFYFDRVSRSTINLAKYYKSKGALIVFEPSSIKDDKQFVECLDIPHIIKFSSDRIKNYSDLFPVPIAQLEIETLGKDGLRYRLKSDKNPYWKTIPSFKFEDIKDTAGAGDWCTAGIINELGFDGLESFMKSDKSEIERALTIGQVMGGINCSYDGARGIMYNMSYQSFIDVAQAILNQNKKIPTIEQSPIKISSISNFKFDLIL